MVLQQDQADCGVACLSSVLRYYEGEEVSLEKLRELSGTNKQGTTLLGLYHSARKLNFEADGYEGDIESLKAVNVPVIIHTSIHNTLEHYLVCFAFENNLFIIGDPSRGIITYSPEELDEIWKSKRLLHLVPNEAFKKSETAPINKKSWLINLVREDYSILVVALVLGILVALIGLSTAVFTQKLIDDLLPSKNLQKLGLGLTMLGVLLVFKAGLSFLRSYFLIRQSKEFNNRIIGSFYQSLLFLPKSFFDTRKIGDLVARMNDTGRIQNTISHVIGNVIINLLIIVVSIGLLFYYYAPIGMISLIGIPLYLFVAWRFNSKILDSQKNAMVAYARNESNYIDTIQGIEAIKVSNKENLFSEITRTIYSYFQVAVFNLGKTNIRFNLFCELIGVGLLISMLSWSSYLVYNNTLTLGEMIAVVTIMGNLIPTMSGLTLTNIQFQEAKVAFERMFDLVSIEPEYTVAERAMASQPIQHEPTSKLKFDHLIVDNLDFNFKGRTAILREIKFELKKGQIVVLLGETGCGKSTLLQVLQKFLDFNGGQILVNGKAWKDVGIFEWRQAIASVPQKIKLFNCTLVENIHLGNISNVRSTSSLDGLQELTDDVIAFCKQWGFDRYFEAFPQGYMTLLGEDGVNLSGGQQQVVAFARALYQKPQLLLLDEATSAMDKKTEAFILDIVNRVKEQMGVLMVTHRHQFARYADVIYSLQEGRMNLVKQGELVHAD